MVFISERWRTLRNLKDEDPQLYEMKLKQIRLEDGIYGMLAKARTAKEREAKREEVHNAVKELVSLGIEERQRRVEELQKMLAKEQEKLTDDRDRIDGVVNHKTDSLIAEGPSALRPVLPRLEFRPDATTRPSVPVR
jgi:ribosomal 50S subunit-associated protein YjgA (DUF615 family)